ncbi:MAG TPA: hypothetical protein VHE33_16400 [Acidobacteriaceae bacterium]|nr:hypothetical protein [Acidobacteriaceae bacterium]
MFSALINGLNPNPDALLRAISAHISDDMLEEIARADYDEEVEGHFAALLPIRNEARFIVPMQWCPGEVLELIRYSQPDRPDWKPGSPKIRGHWMRAFASAALLRAQFPPWNYRGDAAEPSLTLIQLIHSLRALPVDFNIEASRFVAYLMQQSNLEGDDEEVLYYAISLIWFALHLDEPPTDESLIELCEWLVLREAQLAESLPGGFDRWLLGIRGAYPPPSPWERFGPILAELDITAHSIQLQDWVRPIGSQLDEG